jgi:hypothetical protein
MSEGGVLVLLILKPSDTAGKGMLQKEGRQVQGTRRVKGREGFSNMDLVQGASLSDNAGKGTVEVLVPDVSAEQKGSVTVVQETTPAVQRTRRDPGRARIMPSQVLENTAGTESEQESFGFQQFQRE